MKRLFYFMETNMKKLILLFLFTALSIFPQQKTISGRVVDASTFKSLPSASVFIERTKQGTETNSNGEFSFTGDFLNSDMLIVSYLGYSRMRFSVSDITETLLVKMEAVPLPSQSVLVEASVGKEGITPTAFEKINRSEIENRYTVQDFPEMLSSLPSTTFYSEEGNGIGYNYLSIRGFDQRRISVSINGIPQNDPEDHNVYWLDFPDLLENTGFIQVQRGAGAGVFGYPAIGGSINILTSSFSNKPHARASALYGSFNTRKYSTSFSSGLIDDQYSVYVNLSKTLSSGYREGGWADFNSYYVSAARFDDKLTTQLNFYGGPIADGLAYTGLPKFAVKDENLRRKNFSYWEADYSANALTYTTVRRNVELENFSQPHYELLNEYQLNENFTINSALFLVLGDGFFDYDASWADTSYLRLTSEFGIFPTQNPDNTLIRAKVENRQFGWIPRVRYSYNGGELIAGGELRFHKSNHWGRIQFANNLPAGYEADRFYYYYNGGKDIMNGFVYNSYNLTPRLNLLGEIQIASHNYKFQNELYVGNEFNVRNTFFNPRLGINYRYRGNNNIYFSFARVSREPRLKNYYDAAESSGGAVPQFLDEINFTSPLVRPETMNDFEAGTSLNFKNLSFVLNFYYMLFNDEIVRSGQVDRFGQPVTGNVDQTIHRGVELSMVFQPVTGLEFFANATYSNNLIQKGTTFVRYREPVTNERRVGEIDLTGNRISGFPDILSNFGLVFNDGKFYFRLSGRYVGDFYSDNYDERIEEYLSVFPGFIRYRDNKNEAYFTANFTGSYKVNLFNSLSDSKIILQVNNIFDNLYSAHAIGQEFFPAAGRSFIAGVQLGF
jgi:iron complex outermembrane recepter protein